MTDHPRADIIYTKVDEAPELASASLLPIIQRFARSAQVTVASRDISLAGRILAAFGDALPAEQIQRDDLGELAQLVQTSEANVIKLPNISASMPQLLSAIDELQGQGYAVPDYPEVPKSEAEEEIRAKYDQIKGSAVNPVLREGNSDRRAAKAVKAFAKTNPHHMGEWKPDSRTRVATMSKGDFRNNEKSITLAEDCTVRVVHHTVEGASIVLKDNLHLPAGTVVDATFMSSIDLDNFLMSEIEKTRADGLLFSLHMKATMMKVSDPIIFGRAVRAFLAPVFERFETDLAALGVNPNSGLGDLLDRVKERPDILAEIDRVLNMRPAMYMVDSDRGITNLHVPSDVIIDASMPALIRSGGKGWGPDGQAADAVCVIPDSSYAPVYDETIAFFKENGKLNPAAAGTVQNIGLMAQKAEEYGSHPTTFLLSSAGVVEFVLADNSILIEHSVNAGDIWRMASTRKAAIEDWVNLAIERQKAEGYEAIFWLDASRAHDAELIKYVDKILAEQNATANFQIMAPREATRKTLETITAGKNSIAITGNVLRDYLTDLFPILELATSAKMLSIVKLMKGGGLFETGAGGSAPKHVQQLLEENHLRWDSLGEFCALAESFKFLGQRTNNKKAIVLGEAIEVATQGVLNHDRSPKRKVGQTDNRDSHYWFARYWAEALSEQSDDAALAAEFSDLAAQLASAEQAIVSELAAAQGEPVDLGGYYHPDPEKVKTVMRSSPTFNELIG
ncbi:MAG: NADP-dependent isocitrate dehydrogenase [Aestuariivita sp.]|nr:NADP-dependent isocitrate dehydrogenase [Aestuariivita sp.]MCY4347302.1 NADP-dependent isocitrate dehydrogenase [Aestuariivita sp.]